jgi:2-polyprenyl-3-methyl-5-hydroxy-6-metoxy-1,4-benzoquinol methylase
MSVAVNTPEAYYGHLRPEIAVLLPNERTRILEVGCGSGRFRDNLDAAAEYWGVEPDPHAAELARTRLDVVHTGVWSDVEASVPAGYFDVVVVNDVIEHVVDHHAFLRSLAARLRPGGSILGSIPNVRHINNLFELLVQRDWRYRDEGVLDRTHVRFFTKRSFARFVEECGLRVEQLVGVQPAVTKLGPLQVAKLAACAALGMDSFYKQFAFRLSPRS